MKLVEFYDVLAGAVKALPIETFAVIGNYADLNSPNLGRSVLDKKSNFFFSKLWAKKGYPSKVVYEYPILTVFEENFFVTGFFKYRKVCYNLELAVLFNRKKPCKGCSKQDDVNELFIRSERLLLDVLDYLYLIKWDNGWKFNPSDYDERNTNLYKRMLSENVSMQGLRFEGGLDDLFGTTIRLKICDWSCAEELSVDTFVEKIQKNKGCC